MIERTTQLTILPDGEPIYSERCFIVSITDESGGEFLLLRSLRNGDGTISIDPSEWPVLRDAIERMVKECRS